MKRRQNSKSLNLLMAGLLILVLGSVLTGNAQGQTGVAPQEVFTNSTPITIPASGNGSVYPSVITVSNLPGVIAAAPGGVKVTINNFSHTFPGDVGIVLVAPGGAALLLQNGAGDNPDMANVTYTFSDDGVARLPDLTAWTAGTYKPTTYLTGDVFPAPAPFWYANPGPAGGGTATLTSVFGGLIPNGDWKLFVRDFETGDSGSIAGGWTLELTTGPFTSGPQHVSDYNGDGKTDFAVVRNTGGGPSGQITWFIQNSGSLNLYGAEWGIASDTFLPEDYDGDNKSDLAVWRGGAAGTAAFYILQSQTGTLRIELFGQTGDDPAVVGDYDGDGKADPAVYRAGATSGAQSTWFYRGSLNNPAGNVTYVPWGKNGDFPAPGDYDGDGKNDFAVQSNDDVQFIWARFWLLQTSAGITSLRFGNRTDRIVPGDYDGDGKTDLAVIKSTSFQYSWWIRESSTGVVRNFHYGLSATDFPVQGDYDGDGKTDAAVWRPSSTPGASAFWVVGSASGFSTVPFGHNGDYPPANYNLH